MTMKELDRLGRLENRLMKIWAYGTILVLPILAVVGADKFLLHDSPALVRYPVLAVIWIVVLGVCFVIGNAIDAIFQGLRRLFGLKPMKELEREIADEQMESETAATANRNRWIAGMSDGDFRVRIFLMLQEQERLTKKNGEHLYWILLVTGGIAVFLFITTYFGKG